MIQLTCPKSQGNPRGPGAISCLLTAMAGPSLSLPF